MRDFIYGIRSVAKLATCQEDLQRVMRRALLLSNVDIAIITGHRDQGAQTQAFELGYSQTPWPKSHHNTIPSSAVDWAPYIGGRIPWSDVGAFCRIAGVIEAAANLEEVPIRWGGDWDGDPGTPNRFQDLGHIELAA